MHSCHLIAEAVDFIFTELRQFATSQCIVVVGVYCQLANPFTISKQYRWPWRTSRIPDCVRWTQSTDTPPQDSTATVPDSAAFTSHQHSPLSPIARSSSPSSPSQPAAKQLNSTRQSCDPFLYRVGVPINSTEGRGDSYSRPTLAQKMLRHLT